jgi:hypothetical protein
VTNDGADRLLLNQIAIMMALQLCLKKNPPVSISETEMIAELKEHVTLSLKYLNDKQEVLS